MSRWISNPRRRWYLLAGAWVVLLFVGISGFLQQSREAQLGRTFLDNLYLTLQLAALDYGGGSQALNWQLQVTRFVAPVLAAGTLLLAASAVFREEFNRWRLRFLRDHVVVCGLDAAGSRLAVALAKDGRRVVGVDPDAARAAAAAVRDHGVQTLVGDPADAGVLRTVRLDRAVHAVALGSDDAANIAVAAAARQVSRQPGLAPLRCTVQLGDTELADLLRGGDLTSRDGVRVDFSNLHERGARALLAEHPAFGDGSVPPHVVVIGLGQLGRCLVVAAAQRWADDGTGPLRMTLVDRAAEGRLEALTHQHPALEPAIQARCIGIDLEAPDRDGIDEFHALLAKDRPTLVAVTFEDESLALSTALLAHRILDDPDIPVVVRVSSGSGIGALVAPRDGVDPYPGITAFSLLDEACTPEVIEGGVREQLARGMHEDHVARTGAGGGLHASWRDLSEADRESSRRAADALVDDLAAMGCELVPLSVWGRTTAPFAAHETERLAAREHERWRAERAAAGWTHGPVRDDAARHNPLLVPWDQLDAAGRAAATAYVAGMPASLARAGFEVRRVP